MSDSQPEASRRSKPDADPPPRFTRRQLLGATGGLLSLGSLGGLHGFVVEPNWLEVTRHTLPVPDLPPSLDSYTVAHVTDAHLGPWRLVHDQVLESLREIQPDLVISTGDLVERPDDIPQFTRFLGRLRDLDAELLCVLGNWEYRRGGYFIADVLHVYNSLGVRYLRNEVARLADNTVLVAGGDNVTTRHYRPERLLDDLPEAPLRLLALHEPGPFDWQRPDPVRFDLCLAGHTHGGQITFFGHAPITPSFSGRFVNGFYETRHGPAYVSRGIGATRPRIRLSCRPELPVFTFLHASA